MHPGEIRRGAWQPDMVQIANLTRALAAGEISFQDVVKALDNNNVPPQLRQVPFIKVLASATDTPKNLIPNNPNRMGFLLSFIDSGGSASAAVLWTYGARPAPNVGIPLLSYGVYGESNGTVSIDDIWVHPLNLGSVVVNYPAYILGYEGSLAIESHRHRQTRNVGP